jgi:5-methylcytosine-specific restriction endonuclease McrA
MKRYWTFHWQNRSWRGDVHVEGSRLRISGSNKFRDRGVSVGDSVYVITLVDGRLFLGGRMTVGRIVSRASAEKLLGTSNLWDAAEWIIGSEEEGTPLNLHRQLEPSLTKRLRFRSPDGKTRSLYFESDHRLYGQATRGLQELTEESAMLLERILHVTDLIGIPEEVMTVTEELLQERGDGVPKPGFVSDPDSEPTADPEVLDQRVSQLRKRTIMDPPPGQAEPTSILTSGKSFLRDPVVKAWVLQEAKGHCEACGGAAPFDGDDREPFLEVHHVRPLASGGSDRVSNAVALCPNCHRRCHHAVDRVAFTATLFGKVKRLRPE